VSVVQSARSPRMCILDLDPVQAGAPGLQQDTSEYNHSGAR